MIKILLDSGSAVLAFFQEGGKKTNNRWLDECWGTTWVPLPPAERSSSGADTIENFSVSAPVLNHQGWSWCSRTAAVAWLDRWGFVASSPRPQSHCPSPWSALNTWWMTWACPRFASWGFPLGPSSRRRSQITATPALGGTDRTKGLFVKYNGKKRRWNKITMVKECQH